MKKIILLLTFGLMFGQTYISGTIDGTLTSDGNPYFMTDDVICDDCIIDEGVDIKVMPGGYEFTIMGDAYFNGSDENPIFLGSLSGGMGSWEGIKIYGQSMLDASYFHQSGAIVGINIRYNGNQLYLDNCSITNNEQQGIYDEDSDYTYDIISINESFFENYDENVIVGSYGQISITNSTFSGNGSTGQIHMAINGYGSAADPDVVDNSYVHIFNNIVKNGGLGIYWGGNDNSIIPLIIHNNTFYNNVQGVSINADNNFSLNSNIFSENTWTFGAICCSGNPGSLFSRIKFNLFWDDEMHQSNDAINWGFQADGISQNLNGVSSDISLNIYTDPVFTDIENFLLSENSPCIDAGDITLPFDSDGTINDIGANYFNQNINIAGCTDLNACNYNSNATVDDGDCIYPEPNYDCDGNCTANIDCNGECGGNAIEDECGVCGGDASTCIEDVLGCTYEEAENYNANATIDDGSCEFEEYNLGDFNQDGTVNVLDVVMIVQFILGGW